MESGIINGVLRSRADLVFEAAPGLWFYAALALAAFYLIIQYRRMTNAAAPTVRWLLSATRILLFAAVLAFLLKPTILKQKLAELKTAQKILIDTSRSMSLEYDLSSSRLDSARKIIHKLIDSGVVSASDIELFAFDESVDQITLSELEKIEPTGRSSDILGAMGRLSEGDSNDNGKVLVLTDGRNNGPATAYPDSGNWVFVGIGGREEFKDVSIAGLKAAEIGFKGKPVEISAEVKGEGYDEQKIPVSLKVDGKLVKIEDVVLPADGEKKIKFQWTPRETGTYQVSMNLQPVAGEKVADNNHLETTVKVVRDRIRILFISGSPTWNYRFLREALKRDPSLDLISFIILRSPSDVVDVRQDEVSLIPFPTRRLFTKELNSFDLVIFDNFSFRPYFPEEYLEMLKNFVKNGGAFWMWGGSKSFVDGGYRETPLEDILPFSLEGPAFGEGYIHQNFKINFTAQAEGSPVLNLETLPGGKNDYRTDLPALSGFNVVGPAVEGAMVIAEHPSYFVGGKPQPIIAMRSYGEGRVMAVATDYLWAWDFVAAGEGAGNKTYLDFIKNSVRWLVGDPLISPVRLTVSPEAASAGEKISVRLMVLDEHYRPVENASIDLNAYSPQGEKTNLRAAPTDEKGLYEAEFVVPGKGSYRFAVSASGERGKLGEAGAVIKAVDYQKELSSPAMDEEFIKQVSEASGGAYLTFLDESGFYDNLIKLLQPGGVKTRLLSEERISLGSLPAAFALLLIVLSVDWYIRKRYRLE